MGIRDLLYETWHALAANKGRSALTILGIVIGISAVIAMTSLIGGMQNMLVGELGLSQARMLYIGVGTPDEITLDDLDLIEENVFGYEFITGSISGNVRASAGNETVENVNVSGVEPDYFTAMGSKLASGRFFDANDEALRRQVVLLDKNTVRQLFGSEDARVTGKVVKLGEDEYTVIGVLEGAAMSFSNASIYVPYSTAKTRIVGNGRLSQIIGYAQENVDMTQLSERTKLYLARRYSIDNPEEGIYISVMGDLIKELDTMMGAFSAIMSAVAGISLLVGGIGIMNMMLTNVTERIREIGLRKSLGARARDITRQFLLEAIMLCVMGGVFGILFGFAGAWIIGAVIGVLDASVKIVPAFSIGGIAVAVGVCVLIGVVFGYYPARRAAKLDPVESLRYQ